MTTFVDEDKLMLRLLQQNTEDKKDALVRELMHTAHSCMFAGNEARPAEFMQNILFTSGMFIAINFHLIVIDYVIQNAGYFSIALEYVLKSCASNDGDNGVLSVAAYFLMAVARGNKLVLPKI